MKFHYMNRGDLSDTNEIKEFSRYLDSYGYYSLLLTYHSKNYDFLTKSLLAADNSIKLKFMIAIRTYAISPEYLSMICRSYHESYPNKLMLNVVSGDIHKEETSIDDIVMFGDRLSTPEKRLLYTEEWMEKFIKISSGSDIPEIIMGGHSDKTREMCNRFNATHLSMLNMYNDYILLFDKIVNKKQMVSLSIIIRDSKREAEDTLLSNMSVGADQWTICGDRDFVIYKIKQLEKSGVTDIIISKSKNDNQHFRVHELVGDICEKGN